MAVRTHGNQISFWAQAILASPNCKGLFMMNVNEADSDCTISFLEAHRAHGASRSVFGDTVRSPIPAPFVNVHGHVPHRALDILALYLVRKYASWRPRTPAGECRKRVESALRLSQLCWCKQNRKAGLQNHVFE